MAESSSSPSVSEKSDAEIEEMLDRMLTRLALCDDSKLQSLLSNLLPLSISSLSSLSPSVRKKVHHNLSLSMHMCIRILVLLICILKHHN
ncbi:ARM repeat superfamily protein [Actinidia rufa]|uniref:ARM repeat superfamily protein n=1 Tax=Actinidia rufa TaxID=165716 RepID=A0A7J0H4Q6_9ERIC|nr:ARM repeat superfamily protein [Actinidia rufa]